MVRMKRQTPSKWRAAASGWGAWALAPKLVARLLFRASEMVRMTDFLWGLVGSGALVSEHAPMG